MAAENPPSFVQWRDFLKPQTGSVLIDGDAIAKLSTKDVARKLAILPQSPTAPEGLTVLQLVKQGRYPHQSWLKQWSQKDEEIVSKALEATKMEEFQHRRVRRTFRRAAAKGVDCPDPCPGYGYHICLMSPQRTLT